jgi:hypothetical protein
VKKYEGREALHSLTGDFCGGMTMRCPTCERNESQTWGTHIIGVGTLLGCDELEAEVYAGTRAIGKTHSRRSALQITFRCEGCAKRFALVLQQH